MQTIIIGIPYVNNRFKISSTTKPPTYYLIQYSIYKIKYQYIKISFLQIINTKYLEFSYNKNY